LPAPAADRRAGPPRRLLSPGARVGSCGRADEPVPAARQRLDELRVVRGVTKGSTQSFDRGVQAVLEVDERPIGPEPLPQFIAGDDIARAFEHQAEDLERLFLQADRTAALVQLTRPEVQLERSEPQPPIRSRRDAHEYQCSRQ